MFALLEILFFRGRIGRIRFLTLGLVAGLVIGGATFLLCLLFFPRPHSGQPLSMIGFIIPLVIIVPIAAWVVLALQAARIRDIGLKPGIVVPAWLLFTLIDAFVAYKFPEWSIGRQHHTIVGVVVNTALSIIVTFMPSASDDDTPSYPPRNRMPYNVPSAGVPIRNSVMASRSASGARPSFGQRGR